jgi:hypothetical protein
MEWKIYKRNYVAGNKSYKSAGGSVIIGFVGANDQGEWKSDGYRCEMGTSAERAPGSGPGRVAERAAERAPGGDLE